MSDLISRQVAIDAVYEAFCYAYCDNCEKNLDEDLCGDCHRKYQNWSALKKTIEKVINVLLSARPEIIRCKDCKYYRRAWLKKDGTENRRYKNSVCLRGKYAVSHNPDWYCGDAERRDYG